MKINKLKKKRDQVEIIFEDGSKLDLKLKIAQDFNLYEGGNLSEELTGEIASRNEYAEAKDTAYRLLGRRAHSVYELKSKLLKRDYSSSVTDKIILELIEKNYLNDKQFALEFLGNRIRNKKDGINKIVNQLKQRGIKSSIIDEIVSNNKDEYLLLENAIILAQRKVDSIKNKISDRYKLRAKLSLYLQNKGYSFDIIQQVISKLNL